MDTQRKQIENIQSYDSPCFCTGHEAVVEIYDFFLLLFSPCFPVSQGKYQLVKALYLIE